MLFSERLKLAEEYSEWLKAEPLTKDCPLAVITFLDIKGLLGSNVHGEWIDGMEYVNSRWKVCSVCHHSAHESCGGDDFCPHCGADMRQQNQ